MTNYRNTISVLSLLIVSWSAAASAQDVVSEFSSRRASETAHGAPAEDGSFRSTSEDTSSEAQGSEVSEVARPFDPFPASPISFGVSAGGRAGFTSLDEEFATDYNDDMFVRNLGVGATINVDLNLGRWASESMQTELMLGYRGSMSHTLWAMWVDPGAEHHHELSLSVGLLDTMRISVGGGLAVLHSTGETMLGAAAHLDIRKYLPSGMFIAVPFDMAFYPVPGEDLLATFTVGIQFGWNSRQ